MKIPKWIPVLFLVAALYDGILGLVFLLAPLHPFQLYEVTPPNHLGYVRFPAALLLVFGLMFLAVARSPVRNRNLIPYGVLLKVCYCGVAGWYWATSVIPGMWKPFVVVDVIMGVLFLWAYTTIPARQGEN